MKRRRRKKQSASPPAFLGLMSLVAAGALLSLFGLPWWTLVVVAALAGFLYRGSPAIAAGAAFAAGFIVWWAVALYFHNRGGGVLTGQVGQIFLGLNSVSLLLVTGFLGGLLASLGALTGRYGAEVTRGGRTRTRNRAHR